MRAMKHIENYDERGVPFSAWLYRIAHNLGANWHNGVAVWQITEGGLMASIDLSGTRYYPIKKWNE